MIRAVEKQALLSEKIDLLKEALAEGGVTSVASEGAPSKTVPSPGKHSSHDTDATFALLRVVPLMSAEHAVAGRHWLQAPDMLAA